MRDAALPTFERCRHVHCDDECARPAVDKVRALEVVEEFLNRRTHRARRAAGTWVVGVTDLVHVLPVPTEAHAEVESLRGSSGAAAGQQRGSSGAAARE